MDVCFKARPIAVYKPFCDSKNKNLSVFELEVKDIDFLEKYKKQITHDKEFKNNFPVHQDIISSSLESIINVLKLRDKLKINDKSAAFISIWANRITSISQCNMPKIDFDSGQIFQSTRKHSDEGELDWLACVPYCGESQMPKASAPALIYEVFNYCLGIMPKLKTLYCRSEVPEVCDKSVKFYKKIGFEEVSTREKWMNPDNPKNLNYLVHGDKFKYLSGDILPLEISKSNMESALSHIAEKFQREEILDNKSVDLEKLLGGNTRN